MQDEGSDHGLIEDRGRDRGLVRAVGAPAFAASIVNGVVGAGIFALPAAMALSVGPAAPLAFLACAVAMGAVVLCCAEAGSRVPTSGGIYGYVEAAFGPLAGFVAGLLGVWLSAVLACGGIAAAFAQALAAAFPVLGGVVPRIVIIVAVIGGLAGINLRGVGFAARFITITTLVKLIPLGLFLGIGIWFVSADRLMAGATSSTEGFGRAVIFALFAFSGMETPLSASGEVERPARNVPRALIGAMLFVLALYTGIQLVAQGLLGDALATSHTPLADAMGVVSPLLRTLLLAGAALSMFFWIGSDLFGAPRVLFAFGRDGLLPEALGRISARTNVPHVAILVHAGLAIALAISGTFDTLAILAALASTILYSLACAAAWRLQRRDVAMLGTPIRFAILPIAAIAGIASMVAIAVQAKQVEIIGMFAAVAATIVLYIGARLLRRLPG